MKEGRTEGGEARERERDREREGERETEGRKTVFPTSVPNDWHSSNSSEKYP